MLLDVGAAEEALAQLRPVKGPLLLSEEGVGLDQASRRSPTRGYPAAAPGTHQHVVPEASGHELRPAQIRPLAPGAGRPVGRRRRRPVRPAARRGIRANRATDQVTTWVVHHVTPPGRRPAPRRRPGPGEPGGVADAEGARIITHENTVEFYHHSPAPHSDGLLVAYFPQEKILFQGDFSVNPGQPANDHVRALVAALERLGIDYDRYINVHASAEPQTRADVMAAIAMGR